MSDRPIAGGGEELFRRLLAGELARDDEEVRHALALHPEWEEELEEAEHLRGALDSAAAARAALLREGLAEVDSEDRAWAQRQVSEITTARPSPAPRRRWWRDLSLLAACALVVTLVWRWRATPPGASPSGPLDASQAPGDAQAWPVGPVPAVDHFRLPTSLRPGESATILVFRPDDSEASGGSGGWRQVLERRELEDERWELAPEQVAALPPAFLWTYEIRDPFGAVVARGSFEASLSP